MVEEAGCVVKTKLHQDLNAQGATEPPLVAAESRVILTVPSKL